MPEEIKTQNQRKNYAPREDGVGAINYRHHITTWVALVIVAGVAATVGCLVWDKVHENWPFETVTPSFSKERGGGNSKSYVSEWKSCSNQQYGYEFKYPQDWFVWNKKVLGPGEYEYSESTDPSKDCSQNEIKIGAQGEMYGQIVPDPGVSVVIETQEGLKSTIYAGATTLDQYISKFPLKESRKETRVSGEKAVWWIENQSSAYLVFFHGGNKYDVSVGTTPIDLFNQLLSTFKFIK